MPSVGGNVRRIHCATWHSISPRLRCFEFFCSFEGGRITEALPSIASGPPDPQSIFRTPTLILPLHKGPSHQGVPKRGRPTNLLPRRANATTLVFRHVPGRSSSPSPRPPLIRRGPIAASPVSVAVPSLRSTVGTPPNCQTCQIASAVHEYNSGDAGHYVSPNYFPPPPTPPTTWPHASAIRIGRPSNTTVRR